jgi:hypothetical protein
MFMETSLIVDFLLITSQVWRAKVEPCHLAQRISAISLSSADEPPPNKTYQIDTALSEKKNVSSSISFQQLGAQKLHTVFQPQQHYSDRKIPKPTTPRLNGSNIRKYEWKAERNW